MKLDNKCGITWFLNSFHIPVFQMKNNFGKSSVSALLWQGGEAPTAIVPLKQHFSATGSFSNVDGNKFISRKFVLYLSRHTKYTV